MTTAAENQLVEFVITGQLQPEILSKELTGVARGRLMTLIQHNETALKDLPAFPLIGRQWQPQIADAQYNQQQELETILRAQRRTCQSLDNRISQFEQERVANEQQQPIVDELRKKVAALEKRVAELAATCGAVGQ